jgi:hypothetical protein
MTEIEKMIFAAAYALELARRITADVQKPGVTADEWEADCAHLSIEEAHVAVVLYRQERKKQDP